MRSASGPNGWAVAAWSRFAATITSGIQTTSMPTCGPRNTRKAPLKRASGISRATLRASLLASAAPTTAVTCLWAPGASSAAPRVDGHQHRLADRAQRQRQVGVPGPEGARRALALELPAVVGQSRPVGEVHRMFSRAGADADHGLRQPAGGRRCAIEVPEQHPARGHLGDHGVQPGHEQQFVVRRLTDEARSTDSFGATPDGSVTTATSASAACPKAAVRVGPKPRTPMSAPCSKCSRRGPCPCALNGPRTGRGTRPRARARRAGRAAPAAKPCPRR